MIIHKYECFLIETSVVRDFAWFGVNPSVSLSTSENWVIESKSKTLGRYIGLTLTDGGTKHMPMIGYTVDNLWAVIDYEVSYAYVVSPRSVSLQTSTYYTQRFSLINETLHYELYDDNGRLLSSASASLPSKYKNTVVIPCVASSSPYDDCTSLYFKKFSIKKL